MNILMMTNTYLPHVGGVANSIASFSNCYRNWDHRVMIIAPQYGNAPAHEDDVVRIPAIQRFNNSDFSVVLPLPRFLSKIIEQFKPDLIHSHHPFLIGGTALRLAHTYRLPLIFTHHTMYENYTHNVPGDSRTLKRFIVRLSTSYANLCSQVIAPSASVAAILKKRGVNVPIEVVSTGINPEHFSRGSGSGFRAAMNIPSNAFVIGHLGRLAEEKNLHFLCTAVIAHLKINPESHFLLIGTGPLEKTLKEMFAEEKVEQQLHTIGTLDIALIGSAYKSMDLFAFASKSETQGIVLLEAMAAGVPVLAMDAPGARDIVVDYFNGRLVTDDSLEQFSKTLTDFVSMTAEQKSKTSHGAQQTASNHSNEHTAAKALTLYEKLLNEDYKRLDTEYNSWSSARRMIKAEWDLLKNVVSSAEAALTDEEQSNDFSV